MPRDTSDIGSQGLEQGGANLGNDYSRPITTERHEQNTTTNVGKGTGAGNDYLANEGTKLNIDPESGDEGDQGGSMPDPEELSTR